MSQLNDPVALLQQTRSNFIIETDVQNVKDIRSSMSKLSMLIATNQARHETHVAQLQVELKKQQAKVQALQNSAQEQTSHVRKVEDELNIPDLEHEIERLAAENQQLQATIQEGIRKVIETQEQLLESPLADDTRGPISREDRVNVLKLRLFHSMGLNLYQDQILDLQNEALPMDAQNIWDQL